MLVDLWNEAQSHLLLTASSPVLLEGQGNRLDIGEEFEVVFTIRNDWDPPDDVHPHFINAKLILHETPYATPVDGPVLEFGVGTNIPEGGNPYNSGRSGHIGYGGAYSVGPVRFRATAKAPDPPQQGSLVVTTFERYVDAVLVADFDIERFFKVMRRKSFSTEIEDG